MSDDVEKSQEHRVDDGICSNNIETESSTRLKDEYQKSFESSRLAENVMSSENDSMGSMVANTNELSGNPRLQHQPQYSSNDVIISTSWAEYVLDERDFIFVLTQLSIKGVNGQIIDKKPKLFVGGFHSDVTEENLKSHFSQFGTVVNVKIMRNPVTGHSRGFGFVTMADSTSKSRIMEEKEHLICGRRASVRSYTETDTKESFTDGPILKRKIFVGGINPALSHDVLENYFGKFGSLEDATIMRYPDGRSRGFGFVVFRDESACQHVLQQRNHFVTARDKVEVKPCLSRCRSRPVGSLMMEPYYRYPGGRGGGEYSSVHMNHPSGGVNYGYGNSAVNYYNPAVAAALYGQYNRSAPYDGHHAPHGNGNWNTPEYRDWWNPYDAYGTIYGSATNNSWHGAGYASCMTSASPSYNVGVGNSLSRTSGLVENAAPPLPTRGGGANTTDVAFYDPTSSSGGPLMTQLNTTGHPTYGPIRRGGTTMPPAPEYSMPRGRSNAY